MTEKVLNYDSAIVPQETGYWCGPASAQVCLNIRGIYVDEQTLAYECGTDTGGTDWVGMIEGSLDSRLPEANYTSVIAQHDPPTQEECDRFWDALKRSIDAGYGVIMNWVAPPSNYPIGIKGSQSPGYGGGTIYHYVTAAGYDDAGGRAVWIADSGFNPFEYWISFDQCCTLIPPKALCYANVAPQEPGEELPDWDILTYEQLCGPVDPETGYGTGWPQNGQNAAGQNLYLVDLLAEVLKLVDQDAPGDEEADAQAYNVPNYSQCSYEQLAGPWSQLGNRSVNDALVHIRNTLIGGGNGGEPPLSKDHQVEKDRPVVETAKDLAADALSSRLQGRGQRQEQDSPPT